LALIKNKVFLKKTYAILMKKFIAYFTRNSQDETYIIKTKAIALAYLTLVALIIVFVKMGANIFLPSNAKSMIANYGVPGMMGMVALINLFILRKASYRVAGMFFSTGQLVTLQAGMLLAANSVHPINTYVSGFYMLIVILSLSALFGSRKTLILNYFILVACTIYMYSSSIHLYEGANANLAKTAIINFMISLVILVIILYFVMLLTENAQEKSMELAEKALEKNQEIEMHFAELQTQKLSLQSAIEDTNFVVSEAVDSGNFKARIDLSNKEGEWLALSASINKLFETVTTPFSEINNIVNKMSAGDLTGRYRENAKGDVLVLKNNLNAALENLGALLREISESVKVIGSSSDAMMQTGGKMADITYEINSAIREMSDGAQNQVTKVDESSALIEGVARFSVDIGNQASSINDTAKAGVRKGIAGIQQVQQVTEMMQSILDFSKSTSESVKSLSLRSSQISGVLNIIQEIAAQTNLLALNAAIEAAQAGDAGRGFAVVAEEIRKLAEGSKNSTKEIEKLIEDVQADTQKTAKLIAQMNETIVAGEKASLAGNAAFEEIADSYKQTLELSQKIMADTSQQAKDVRNIVTIVEAVVVIAEETAAGTEQAAMSSNELSSGMTDYSEKTMQVMSIVAELQKKVDQFKLAEAKEREIQVV
jgi:methyl-accepting chemotaxis protein